VGCRGSAKKSDLVRFVADGTALVCDPHQQLPGRGAYVHRNRECVAAAERRRAWHRALRVTGPLDLSALQTFEAAASDVPPWDRESAVRKSTR